MSSKRKAFHFQPYDSCPNLIDPVLEQKIDPDLVFDLALRLRQVAEGYSVGRAPRHQGAAATLKMRDRTGIPRLQVFRVFI